MRRIMSRLLGLVLLFHLFVALCFPQSVPTQSLALEDAVNLASKNYPSIQTAQAQAAAAKAGIDVARTAYLPKIDLLWQENRATRNNVFGLLLPQSVIPSISGPVLGTNNSGSAWGSASGLLFSWEPFDFGLRKANVELARAVTKQAQAGVGITQLDVTAAAADAFLGVIAADEAVRAAQANVERLRVFSQSVQVLVQNQLRPGVDSSRAEAELATARNLLIQAEQNALIARANLAEAIGVGGTQITVDAGSLLSSPPDAPVPVVNLETHPLSIAQNAAVETAQAREHILDRSYFPRFYFQSAFYGRGTGALLDGQIDNNRGLYPQTFNWATGMSVSFPLLDIFSIHARKRVEANNVLAEQSRRNQTLLALKAQDERARALIDGARRIAANTPIQLKAAQETEVRARARYEAELATVVEVAESQRLLTQAEIDDAIARLNVWRSMLIAAKAQGDLKPFLQQVIAAPVQKSKQEK